MRAIGYHWTSVQAAQRILSSGFQASRNEYDWLGDGAYFFQDAPARALEWARRRFGDDAAVVGAEIDLDDCIDLLDVIWQQVISRCYDRYHAMLQDAGLPLPRQTRGAHRVDRSVMNYVAQTIRRRGLSVTAVRAVFAEGDPLFPGSALLSRSHVQIAVREPSAILRIWEFHGQEAPMLDPVVVGKILEHHFATVTPEEFIANVRRVSPESARELWGDLSAAEILARRDQSRRESRDLPNHGSEARPGPSGEGVMIDPQKARAALKEYHATASDQQIVEDLWRFSPELARRLGVAPPGQVTQPSPEPGRMRGFFSAFRRSVLRIFS
jgi:hypothetical protein